MKDDDGKAIPNPGSDAAKRAGCICAVMDNNHGKWAPVPPNGWWVTEGCPIHDKRRHHAASDPPTVVT